MARARKHYRVAQKANEAQVYQREDEQRRDILITCLIISVLVTQIVNLAIKLYELVSDNSDNNE